MTTTLMTEHRKSLIQHLEAGDSTTFLTLATPYLSVCLDDEYLLLMAVREYLNHGLVGPAKALLSRQTGLTAELVTVRESLDSLPDGVVPWSSLAEPFEANLSVLMTRGVDVAALRDAWQKRSDSLCAYRDRRGNIQVLYCQDNGTSIWVPALADHKKMDASRPLPEGIKRLMPGPFLFDGLGLGGYFERVYRASLDTFLGYSCALFVLEPDPLWLALVLHLNDWRVILADPRVFWLIGPEGAHQLKGLWEREVDLPFPTQLFSMNGFRPATTPNLTQVVQQTAEQREADIVLSGRNLQTRYADRDLSYWAKRFENALTQKEKPLRILAAVSTHTTFLQYSMRDAKRAFESLGHEFQLLTEKTSYTTTAPLTYHQAIESFDPDLFFVIDHLRPEFSQMIPENLPVMTWDQDQLPHVFTEANMKAIGPLDFVTGYSKSRCVTAGCNPQQFLYARVPTCAEQFSGAPLTDDELSRYTCEVSYVSHASQTPEAFHQEEWAKQTDQNLRRVMELLYEDAPAAIAQHRILSNAVAQTMLDKALSACRFQLVNQEVRTWLISWYLWRLGDRLFRHQALEWVAQWAKQGHHAFRIYGNGWDKHPTLSRWAAGPAQNGRELLCIYRASRINLQLMPAGFIHQRSLDGLAAGGFFLCRTAPNDLKGHQLRRLMARASELGITNTQEFLACPDETLRQYLEDYHGQWLDQFDHEKNDLFGNFKIMAELEMPDEVFEHFSDILFDSSEEFAARADDYLDDEEKRRSITQEMRSVVVERFSYRSAMDRFIHTMADYLKEAAHENA